MEHPWLHVLVPAYGESPYLAETLASWSAEWLLHPGDVRVTVVDDATPGDHVAGVASRFPGVDYLRNEQNLGVAANFNLCAQLSQGSYTVLCGSDDLVLPGYVRVLARLRDRFPGAGMLMPGVQVIDQGGSPVEPLADRVKSWIAPRGKADRLVPPKKLATSLLIGNWLYFPAICWCTELLREFGFRVDQTTAMDLDLELRIAFAGHGLAYSPERCFCYRRHEASVSSLEAVAGRRFREEDEVSDWAVKQAEQLGWTPAEWAARIRLSSRGHRLLRRAAAGRAPAGGH